jgi:GTP pyrophosphokinase
VKTTGRDGLSAAAPIVEIADVVEGGAATASKDARPEADVLSRARVFAEPLLAGRLLDTGEEALAHADGVADILQHIGAAPSMRVAAYLVYAGDSLADPETVVAQAFGPSYASLVTHTRKLVRAQRQARQALAGVTDSEVMAEQLERVRKMLLAFSRDLRVVLLRLASRLQTMRYFAVSKRACPVELATETQRVFAPLANRLGIWQIKWELEDLAFRFLQPQDYKQVAVWLDEKRVGRELGIEAARTKLAEALQRSSLDADVSGRPKHIYSIWKKMHGKSLPFDRVFDVRALRVLVDDVPACYAALSRIHELWRPLPDEFDDYIARPKSNGYQSLHTVVLDDEGRPVEIQIRTRAMHDHAESGVAAHWAYKEAGAKGYAGVSAAGDFEDRVAIARRAVLHQLLAWERDLVDQSVGRAGQGAAAGQGVFEDRIYVFTPQATLIELPAGATAVDFAYHLHTDVGHRCRGARVDGAMLPLNTPLQSGQTIEVVCAKEGGPSLDWLNAQLGFLHSPRARSKVRAWFNAQAMRQTIARGREAVERLLQREGRTALKLDDLATQLGFRDADALFEVVGKDEYSLRNIELLLRPVEPAEDVDVPLLKRSRSDGSGRGAVLVVGVESLLTQLARCCRPAPPDAINGFVTRGNGVAIHRADCANMRQLLKRDPERVIAVAWGDNTEQRPGHGRLFPVDVSVMASDRQGLLRDISEVFAKEKMNVTGVKTQSVRGTAWMMFTVEVGDAARLSGVLTQVSRIPGVASARRR